MSSDGATSRREKVYGPRRLRPTTWAWCDDPIPATQTMDKSSTNHEKEKGELIDILRILLHGVLGFQLDIFLPFKCKIN